MPVMTSITPAVHDRRTSKAALYAFMALSAFALVLGISQAVRLAFVNDDAFISFRYARNLVNGLGLVYNTGERVEGFTNFLWTLLIALGMKLQLEPVAFSETLGIVFYGMNILLCSALSWRLRTHDTNNYIILPLTAIALSFHRDFAAYATSGLETSMFTFLVSLAYAALLLQKTRTGLVCAGVFLVLAMMTRPDGVIFLAGCVAYLLLTNAAPFRSTIVLILPSIVLFLPYWLWRFEYFGFFFPNSFYAKSIDLPYYGQGLEYALMYIRTYYVFALLPILAVVYFIRRRRQTDRRDLLRTIPARPLGRHPILLAMLLIIFYSAFIIRIGGDFMFARFFVPVTPLLFLALERLIHLISQRMSNLIFQCIVVLATMFRVDQFHDQTIVGYIADEALYYTREDLEHSRKDGATLHKYFDGLPVSVAFWAGQVKLMYYADPAVAIETSTGLTDTAIAHQAIAARGRPGHEKNATGLYLMKRRVNFYLGPTAVPPPKQQPLNAIVFDYILARIVVYDNAVMSRLERFPEVKFIHIPEYLDSYIDEMGSYSIDRVKKDYEFFRPFYFEHNRDSTREAALLRYIASPQGSAESE